MAENVEDEFGKEAADFIRYDVYVDHGLTPVSNVEKAINLIKAVQGICAKAGLKLQKIMTSRKEVLLLFPVEERAKGLREVDLKIDPLPVERALGVVWWAECDSFHFRIEFHNTEV